jgi:transcriptional regulator with XRE-family HTH domain
MEETGIAERFKEIRLKRNINQKEFSESLNVSQSVVSDIEAGKREPSRQILSSLAKNYNVDLNWLLLGVSKSISDAEVERLKKENTELKKNVADLELENKTLSKELIEQMRQMITFQSTVLGNSTA